MEKDFDIFISYSHKDLNKVKEIKAIIEQSTVARCWMDLKGGIKSGDPKFIKTITDAINNSVVFLFMRSANSQISEYATLELSYAKKETNSHVVIVNIDDSEWINEFRFLYRYTDKIDWANQDQREKLMSDIQSWIEKRNEIKSKAEEEARSIVEAKIQKLEKEDIIDWDKPAQKEKLLGDISKWTKLALKSQHSYTPAKKRIYNFLSDHRFFLTGLVILLVVVSFVIILFLFFLRDSKLPSNFEELEESGIEIDSLTADSLYIIGEEYFYGKNGRKENHIEAAKYYFKSAKKGNAFAEFSIGWMYENGDGLKQNDEEAVNWYRKAAYKGLPVAQFNLAYMYDSGTGVTQSETEAFNWYRKAAEQDLVEAQFALGYMYSEGNGVQQNDSISFFWYLKAAEQGLDEAQHIVGMRYEMGLGVKQNKVNAAYWYREAAKNGHKGATEKLEKLNN